MAKRTISKRFSRDFRGLDLRDPDLLRSENYSPEVRNVITAVTGNLENRPGYKIRLDKSGAPSLGKYAHVYQNTTSGATEEEVLGISDKLYRRIATSYISIQYTGAETNATLSFYLDEDTETFVMRLDVDGTVTEIDCGTGLEASPVTLTDLATNIDALTDFTASVTGSGAGSLPAATTFPLTYVQDIKTAEVDFTIYQWSQVNQTISDPFDAFLAARFSSEFHNAHFIDYKNICVIATGYDRLYKYDGQTVYLFGLPEASTAPTVVAAGTGFTDTDINYFYRYKQVDNRGNINFGVESEVSNTVSPNNDTASVTVANILAGSGFNTNCAIVNGLQAAVTTITVDNTNTLQIGDTAYFYDTATSAYVTRTITGRTSTSITFAGAVSVADNAVISNNLRIEIYRNTNGGLTYALVAEIPNDSFNATQVYADATGTRGASFREPVFPPDQLEWKPRALAVCQGVLCACGDSENPNTVFLNDPENPEAFPAATHAFDVESGETGILTALAADQESLVMFKKNAVYLGTGDLQSLIIRVQKVHEGQIGASSPHAVREVQGSIVFLCDQGFYSIKNGFVDQDRPIGERIQPAFLEQEETSTFRLKTRRAILFNDIKKELLIAYVPTENSTSGDIYPNDNARIFVYEYNAEKRRWLEWANLNMAGGIYSVDDEVWFSSKEYDAGSLNSYEYKASTTGTIYDYEDHHEAIEYIHKTQWDDDDESELQKVALRAKIYNQSRDSAAFTLDCHTERDYNGGEAHSNWQWTFGEGGSQGWGIPPWGVSPWGAPVTLEKKIKLYSGKHRAIAFVLESEYHNQKISYTALIYEKSANYDLGIRQ